MKHAWVKPAAVAFGLVAVLGGIAYYLERSKRELDGAVRDAFKVGGWLSGFADTWGTSNMPSVKGVVTEGSDTDFTVKGTFEPTAAQLLRSQPRKV